MTDTIADPLKALEPIGGTRVSPAMGVAALALSFALKYHDIATIQDGTLYQQYKLEGRNMRDLHLDIVFETAILMEAHLLASSDRVGKLVIDALEAGLDKFEEGEGDASAEKGREGS